MVLYYVVESCENYDVFCFTLSLLCMQSPQYSGQYQLVFFVVVPLCFCILSCFVVDVVCFVEYCRRVCICIFVLISDIPIKTKEEKNWMK